MKLARSALLAAALSFVFVAAAAAEDASWTQPQKPFRLYGDTYYVGTQGLSAILIVSPQGDVLIDGTLPRNAPQIKANIRALGIRLGDVKAILNSHAHDDHAGAIAELAKASGAKVYASAAGARALELGGKDPDDPLYGETSPYPPIAHVQVVADGGVVRVGELQLTAHYTPGHTPGSTSWTWRSCEGKDCLSMAYVDSLTPMGAASFRFSGDATHASRVPAFRHSLQTVAALPCDILITPHPGLSYLMARVARRDRGDVHALIDPQACRAYAADATTWLDARVAKEQQAPAGKL